MEMTLTVHVPRRRPRPVDVVVRWSGRHTAHELAAALAAHLHEPVAHLSSRGRAIPAEAVVGEPPLLHGAEVTLDAAGPGGGAFREGRTSLLHVAVVGGPDAGHARALAPAGVQVGRAPASGLVVADDSLSRVHAALRVDEAGPLVEDLGSTNGVFVGSRATRGPTRVDTASVITMGASTLRLRRLPGPGAPALARGDGRLVVQTAGRDAGARGCAEVVAPDPPPQRQPVRVPWVAALVPVPVGLVLAYFLGPQLLAFALLGPVMLLAGALGDRWGAGRARRRDAAAHACAMQAARDRLADAVAEERDRLDHEHPDPHAILVTAEHRLAGLWRGDATLPLRLGLGDVATAVTWVEGGRRERPRAPHTPVVLPLADVGHLAVVGPPALTDAVLRSLVGQLCVTQAPHDLGLVMASGGEDPRWAWSARLPHAMAQPSSADAGAWPAPPGDGPPARRVLVVPDGAHPDAAAQVGRALTAGWLVIVAATDRAVLPAPPRAVVSVHPGEGSLDDGTSTACHLVVDGVGPWWADRLSRALAPLTCAAIGPGRPQSLPDRVTLEEVLPTAAVVPHRIVEEWRSAPAAAHGLPPPVAVVGRDAEGPYRVDLARDGPHLLVGGTTGSGKSEFLRTLVTSLAVSSSPADLNLVLVDYKGGAAFGPCSGLPHVVGVVTDLDDHLASRALVSLRAELRRRERLLVDAGVQDVDDYAASPAARSQPLPRLVVVVDELRTLVDEVPAFVNGLVRIAAQGRSLGIHLVLATQRPAGAVTAEVQANVSLRVAFRVRDRADSISIVDDGAAAGIHPGTPGRAVVRGPDGVLRTFQAAILAPTPEGDDRPTLQVLSPAVAARDVAQPGAGDTAGDQGERARHSAGVVATIRAAHRLTGEPDPRRPWVPALPACVTLDEAALVATGARPAGAVALGFVDEPDRQRTDALLWRPADGTWLVAGRPGSGRTTALRALVAAAVARHTADHLHVHVVDPDGGLGDLHDLPHLGTRVSGKDRRPLRALVDHLAELVAQRRQHRVTHGGLSDAVEPAVLVVVDGWERLLEAQPDPSGGGVVEDLARVLRDGAAVGVVAAVSGGRSLLHPRWAALGSCTIVLGPLDPLDLALAGLRADDVPRDPPPGRGVRLGDRREVQLALATADDLRPYATAPGVQAGSAPWRFRPLPTVAPLPATWPSAAVRDALGPGSGATRPAVGTSPAAGAVHPIGIFGQSDETWCWIPGIHGRVLLVAGPAGSGRSTALRALAGALAAGGRSVLMVSSSSPSSSSSSSSSPSPSPWPGKGSVEVAGAQSTASPRFRNTIAGEPIAIVEPRSVEAVVEARRANPRLAVLVDDADLLDDAPVAPVLREMLDLVDRDDGLFVAATTTSRLATRFRGLDVAVAGRRTGLLLQPGRGDGDVLAAPVDPDLPRLPGRGVFVSARRCVEVQVFLAPDWDDSGSGAGRGGGLAVRVGARDAIRWRGDAQGGNRGDDRECEHEPPHEGLVALHEPEADRHEQGAPHERRRPRPVGTTGPAPGQGGQPQAADEDEHRRHDDPGRVAAFTDDQLVDVEHGERHEGGRLDTGQRGSEPAGAG